MQRSEIEEKLNEANYDELTVSLLTTSLLEFQELFKERYVSINDAIKQITSNITRGVVLYDDADSKYDATCSLDDKEFKVDKSLLEDSNYLSYVFFHEMIHAISYRDFNEYGVYMGFYNNEGDYAYKVVSFNEAFTEYLTIKRNELVGYSDKVYASGYDVGVDALKMLTNIISDEELIDCYFNHPYDLEKIISSYGMNLDDLLYAFHLLEGSEVDLHLLSEHKGLDHPENVLNIINGERLLFYSMEDYFGKIISLESFKDKWEVLFKEKECKYNYYVVDGILRYFEFMYDLIGIDMCEYENVKDLISENDFNRYLKITEIFSKENDLAILKGLKELYLNDYDEYYEVMKDNAGALCYKFFDKVVNNYFLYDIEVYPKLAMYLDDELDLSKIVLHKIYFEREKLIFNIFNIEGEINAICNYTNVEVEKIDDNNFKVIFADGYVGYLKSENDKYSYSDSEGDYEAIVLY